MKKYFPGARVGRLTLIGALPRLAGQRLRWSARCECGRLTSVYSSGLTQTQSCGCLQREVAAKSAVDLVGREIGYLLVLRENGRDTSGRVLWLCRCRCGREVTIDGSTLRRNERRKKPRGCGQRCTKRKYAVFFNASQGGAYNSWRFMLRRCTNPNDPHFAAYGGRGITVCERWKVFDHFLADMGERPAGRTLGRIDNDGNYEPTNCEWQDRWQQASNRRSTHLVSFMCPCGCCHTTTQTIAQWERTLEVGHQLRRPRQHEE